jgi:hypothetical protein
MATVNFSVPEDVKAAFDRAFRHTNKSAIIARLMRRAVEEEALAARRRVAAEALTRLRGRIAGVTPQAVRKARAAARR